MTVHKDHDAANMLTNPNVVAGIEKHRALEAEIHARAISRRRLAELPMIVGQAFDLLDDMQQITNKTMTPEEVGSVQAKLIILRINLNVHFGVNTPQLH
jgi:hypothetical protein